MIRSVNYYRLLGTEGAIRPLGGETDDLCYVPGGDTDCSVMCQVMKDGGKLHRSEKDSARKFIMQFYVWFNSFATSLH